MIEELGHGAGAVVSDGGRFTLARDQARDKMAAFSLTSPHQIVEELVRAATLKSARFVRIRMSSSRIHVELDGDPFDLADMEALWVSALDQETDRVSASRKALALALCTAHYRFDARVAVLSKAPGRPSARLLWLPRDADSFGEDQSERDGTEVIISMSARNPFPMDDSVQKLKRSLLFSSVDASINGEKVSRGLDLKSHLDVVGEVTIPPADGPGAEGRREGGEEDGERDAVCEMRGRAGFSARPRDPAKLLLVRDGILVETEKLAGAAQGFAAVVEHPGFSLDLSRSRVLEDKALAEAEEAAREAARRSAASGDIAALQAKARIELTRKEVEKLVTGAAAVQRRSRNLSWNLSVILTVVPMLLLMIKVLPQIFLLSVIGWLAVVWVFAAVARSKVFSAWKNVCVKLDTRYTSQWGEDEIARSHLTDFEAWKDVSVSVPHEIRMDLTLPDKKKVLPEVLGFNLFSELLVAAVAFVTPIILATGLHIFMRGQGMHLELNVIATVLCAVAAVALHAVRLFLFGSGLACLVGMALAYKMLVFRVIGPDGAPYRMTSETGLHYLIPGVLLVLLATFILVINHSFFVRDPSGQPTSGLDPVVIVKKVVLQVWDAVRRLSAWAALALGSALAAGWWFRL